VRGTRKNLKEKFVAWQWGWKLTQIALIGFAVIAGPTALVFVKRIA